MSIREIKVDHATIQVEVFKFTHLIRLPFKFN